MKSQRRLVVNAKLMSIILSCTNADQVESCYLWVQRLTTVSDEQREILVEILTVKRECFPTRQVGLN